jgi:hypothetical protein
MTFESASDLTKINRDPFSTRATTSAPGPAQFSVALVWSMTWRRWQRDGSCCRQLQRRRILYLWRRNRAPKLAPSTMLLPRRCWFVAAAGDVGRDPNGGQAPNSIGMPPGARPRRHRRGRRLPPKHFHYAVNVAGDAARGIHPRHIHGFEQAASIGWSGSGLGAGVYDGYLSIPGAADQRRHPNQLLFRH